MQNERDGVIFLSLFYKKAPAFLHRGIIYVDILKQ
jgi:hypothetical protein